MSKEQPVISICIPTYNRCRQLEQALESIICQQDFDRVEIIISDNFSTDNTEKIGRKYCEKYSNIKYYRNSSNVLDRNHLLALQRGTGKVRKLSNDRILYKQGAISYMVSIVEKHLKERPLLYFLNGARKINKEENFHGIEYDSLDSFIYDVSYEITWIASVAVWEEDCECNCICTNIYKENEATRLAQVPYLISIFQHRKKAIVFNKVIMKSIDVEKKDLSYGLYNIFYTGFLSILNKYVKEGILKKQSYDFIREDLLINFFSFWVLQYKIERDRYLTSDEELEKLIERAYQNEKYYKKYKYKLFKEVMRHRFLTIYYKFLHITNKH